MTIAWAIIVVAVFYLIDKHHLWKKAIIAAGILASLYVLGLAGLFGYEELQPKWEAHVWTTHHDCFNPSSGEVHKTSGRPTPCQWDEEVHDRETPLPDVQECKPEEDKPPVFVVTMTGVPKRYWQDGYWCRLAGSPENIKENPPKTALRAGDPIPPYAHVGSDGVMFLDLSPVRQDTPVTEAKSPTLDFTNVQPLDSRFPKLPSGARVAFVPTKDSQYSDLPTGAQVVYVPPKPTLEARFGNAVCVGRQYLVDYRDANTKAYGPKHCDFLVGDPHDLAAVKWDSIPDGERLQVSGRSELLEGVDHGDSWYLVTTRQGRKGYVDYTSTKCDSDSESCKSRTAE